MDGSNSMPLKLWMPLEKWEVADMLVDIHLKIFKITWISNQRTKKQDSKNIIQFMIMYYKTIILLL